MTPPKTIRRCLTLVLTLALAPGLAGCATLSSAAASGRPLVVAAENVWGSIARQLGGGRVNVTSIVTNPNADPHDYEPTVDDARQMADARFVIVNGVGYDPWAQKLLDANPVPGRVVLNVGHLAGVPDGGNPHLWYSPTVVLRVVDAITAEYRRLLPGEATAFDRRRDWFLTQGLGTYHALIAEIRATYEGVPVGASESIFVPLAHALGLDLVTPTSFLTAVSEGVEPTTSDKTTIDRQIRDRRIELYVYNRQNATPDVQRQIDEARRNNIPVTTITETLVPAGATFQAWQVAQLRSILSALERATGR